jgi:hypothetical protein
VELVAGCQISNVRKKRCQLPSLPFEEQCFSPPIIRAIEPRRNVRKWDLALIPLMGPSPRDYSTTPSERASERTGLSGLSDFIRQMRPGRHGLRCQCDGIDGIWADPVDVENVGVDESHHRALHGSSFTHRRGRPWHAWLHGHVKCTVSLHTYGALDRAVSQRGAIPLSVPLTCFSSSWGGVSIPHVHCLHLPEAHSKKSNIMA